MVIEGQSGRKSRSSKRKLVIKSVTFEGFVGTEVVFSDKLRARFTVVVGAAPEADVERGMNGDP